MCVCVVDCACLSERILKCPCSLKAFRDSPGLPTGHTQSSGQFVPVLLPDPIRVCVTSACVRSVHRPAPAPGSWCRQPCKYSAQTQPAAHSAFSSTTEYWPVSHSCGHLIGKSLFGSTISVLVLTGQVVLARLRGPSRRPLATAQEHLSF